MNYDKMSDEERRKVLIAMYFLQKGAFQLDRIVGEFRDRDTDEENREAKEKIINLFQSIARIDDLYLYSDDEEETQKIFQLQDCIYEWIEDNGFTAEIKQFFDKNHIMFS